MKETLGSQLSAVFQIASSFLLVTLMLVSVTGSTGSAASSPDWEKAVTAAHAEGKLILITQAGTGFRKMVEPFKAKFPQIEVEQTLARAHLAAARVVSEQTQGVYNWDVMVAPTSNMATLMSDAGAFQSILPFFILPDVTDGKKWHNGFAMWANDVSEKPYTFIYKADLSGGFSVNRNFVPGPELKHAKELLDPAWKGKIITGELGRPAAPSLAMTAFFHFLGEDFIRKLLVNQETVIIPEARLLLDRLVRGQNPIAIGESSHRLAELQKAGIGREIERLLGPLRLSTYGVAVFKNAPNPNAAKVFINWFLSKEGQKAAVDAFGESGGVTRRMDVAPQDPVVPDWNNLAQYLSTNQESGAMVVKKFITFYKNLRK